MKKVKFLSTVVLATLLFTACSKDDDTPLPVNEEEVITTITVTLSPQAGGPPITLQTKDLDGDGPNAPEIIVSGPLTAGAAYNGSIVLLNETVTPAENITLEVEKENIDHQIFYTLGGSLDLTTTYTNFDDNGNPLGTQFSLTAGAASSGAFTITLRHLPTKPNTGLGDAGGETDIAATFNVSVQ
jgi:hypothetical protein